MSVYKQEKHHNMEKHAESKGKSKWCELTMQDWNIQNHARLKAVNFYSPCFFMGDIEKNMLMEVKTGPCFALLRLKGVQFNVIYGNDAYDCSHY